MIFKSRHLRSPHVVLQTLPRVTSEAVSNPEVELNGPLLSIYNFLGDVKGSWPTDEVGL